MQIQDMIQQQSVIFNGHDAAGFAAAYAPAAVVNDPQYGEPLSGSAAITEDIRSWFEAFPDIRGTVGNVITEGDKYAAEWIMQGTHEGPLQTPDGPLPPTHKRVSVSVAVIGRVDAMGQIIEERRYYDLHGLLIQLGLLP